MPETINDIAVFRTCREMSEYAERLRDRGASIGLVPTMGALHAGHLSLVDHSLQQTDHTIVTLFVNPTQFAAGEDLDRYPRPFEQDMQLLGERKVHAVFAPVDAEMYPPGWSTRVQPPAIARNLEGEFRPEHFGGVATIVLKLLNITRADYAFFGQKDYQQGAVIQQMVVDLNVPATIQICPIVREPDGLALSSRNVYLSPDEREIALSLNQTLKSVRKQIEQGETDAHALMSEMRQMLIDGGVSSIDYAVVADPVTLTIADEITRPVVALVAAQVGSTRLIDNDLIQ